MNEDGLARMGEADFLDRLVPIGVIGRNVKEELAKGLKLRNGCGHPNSLKIGPNMVASHLETLLLNVFDNSPSRGLEEEVGFEPTDGLHRRWFQDRCLKPLGRSSLPPRRRRLRSAYQAAV